MAEKIVVALGGNALQSGKSEATAEAQLAVVKETFVKHRLAEQCLMETEKHRVELLQAYLLIKVYLYYS